MPSSFVYPTPGPAVKAAITVLSAAMPGILVSVIMPDVRPTQFVRVSRVGGRMLNMVTDAPRLLIECWGPDPGTCESMTNTARAALLNSFSTFQAGVYVRGWRNEQGPVDFPDPHVTDMQRWQFHGDYLVSTSTR